MSYSLKKMRCLLLLGLVALVGCQSAPTRDPAFSVIRPSAMPLLESRNGAIYQAGYSAPLFEDQRARLVGDMLTILLNESTDASKTAETDFTKTNTTTITNPTVLGSTPQFNLPGQVPLTSTRNNTLDTNLSSSSAFDGEAESVQSNTLTGEITVTVAEVLPNGNLVVQGEKILTLNQGHEHIRFSGIVRAADIDANNTVSSPRVANARIIYAGEGALADSNSVGWLAKFFIGALMPF